MQCHRCNRGIRSSGQETSLLADRLIHCLPVCVSDKAAPVPSQGPHWVQSRPHVMQQVYSLRAGACHSEPISGSSSLSSTVFSAETSDHKDHLRMFPEHTMWKLIRSVFWANETMMEDWSFPEFSALVPRLLQPEPCVSFSLLGCLFELWAVQPQNWCFTLTWANFKGQYVILEKKFKLRILIFTVLMRWWYKHICKLNTDVVLLFEVVWHSNSANEDPSPFPKTTQSTFKQFL